MIKIKDKLSIKILKLPTDYHLETIFKRFYCQRLNFYNLVILVILKENLISVANNFDFYKKNDVTILRSNIDDLIIIPHSFDNALRIISLKNCESPRSKIKEIKFIFYDDNFIEHDTIRTQMKVNDIFHCDVKNKYRYTKMFIDDTHEIIFDLNDENNWCFFRIKNYANICLSMLRL